MEIVNPSWNQPEEMARQESKMPRLPGCGQPVVDARLAVAAEPVIVESSCPHGVFGPTPTDHGDALVTLVKLVQGRRRHCWIM